MRLNVYLSAAFLVAISMSRPLQAQYGMSGGTGFDGSGTVIIERAPERMRLQVQVLSKAANLKEALAGLKSRVETARKKVITLGAQEDSIKIDPARISSEKSDQQKRMEMMMVNRMRAKGKKAQKAPKAQPVTVASTLTAEFPLKGKAHEALLVEVQALQDSVKAADLAGREAATKLTPEEQEAHEEMNEAGMGMHFGNDDELKPGDPVYIFVTSISEAERTKALAEAFRKANADAAQLAKAAGMQLGTLKVVTGNVANANESEDYGMYNSSGMYRMALQRMRVSQGQMKADEKLEATGVNVGPVKCSVTVFVGYAIGAK